MIVTIDSQAGFCFGVNKTIEIAEQELAKDGHLLCLGQIVHNEEEENRLKKMGLIVINHEEFNKLKNVKVLIRAHGEPPKTYKIAAQNNIQLIDASCPIVLALQRKIRKSFEKSHNNGTQIVIYGKKNHPEVIGLTGQTGNTAIIIENEEDIGRIDFSKPVNMFAQTTKSPQVYQKIIAKISEKLSLVNEIEKPSLLAENSICRHVSNRDENLKQFASENDVVIFVGGRNSSNGKYLFEICKAENPKTWYIQSAEMLRIDWFEFAKKAGVTGGTSTPAWLLSEVAKKITLLTNKM